MSTRKSSLSIAEAQRIVLAAQHFDRVSGIDSVRDVVSIVRRLGALQIDSVNVLVRSHYLPLFSRAGAYDTELLHRAAYDGRRRRLFEYWGHEASFLPVECYPLFQWRMERARRGEGTWGRLKRYATEHQDLVASALAQIRERGPLGASELEASGRSAGGWWGWSQGKEIMEWLFWSGQVTTASRRNFERRYDLVERALPAQIVSAPVPAPDDAQRRLLEIAARALGVATARDLRDYFRLSATDAAQRLRELTQEGILVPVNVEGWKQQAWLHRDVRLPRSIEATALLSPFDSLIWERQRTERLFDFSYRLEIYTPAHKRLHGYYVLPLLLGSRIVARVDLKSDRAHSQLQVRGGSLESGVAIKEVTAPLRRELQRLAHWLSLETVQIVSRRGELMRALRAKSA